MPLNRVSILTFFEETVGQGIGPNGTTGGTVSTGAEWEAAELAGTAFQMPHDPSSLSRGTLKKTPLYPEQASQRVKETQRADYGLSNSDLSFASYLTGRGSALADGVTATQTALSRALLNCFGGVHYTATHTLAGGGHTTTVLNVDSAATYEAGAVVAWEDADGLCHPVTITDVTGTQVTVTPALPSAPSDGDLLRGGATLYIDEDVLTDTSANLGSTLSGCLQKGANGSAGYEVNGVKLALNSIEFKRNDYPSLSFSGNVARFSDPSVGPDPTMPVVSFPAPKVIGPDTQVQVADAGTTTLTTVCNGEVTIDPGLPVKVLECMTARTGNMEGIGLYSMEPADTIVDIDLFPQNVQWFTDQNNEQDKQISIVRLAGSGECFGVFCHQSEINEVGDADGDFLGSVLKFRAVEVAPETSATALERSVIRIFLG